MARRSRELPPYEVLGGRRSVGAPQRGDAGETVAGPDQDESLIARWLARTRNPIVVRIPRGFAILIGAGVLGLVALAYWVGQARGTADVEQVGPAAPVLVPEGYDWPQVAGRRYFVLTAFPVNQRRPSESLKLALHCARFLRRNGVETAIEPLANGDLQLVDLMGFEPDEVGTDAWHDRMGRLKRLGRSWKVNHGGADEFSMMRAEPYNAGLE